VPYDPNAKVFTAWDLGFRDDTAIWWFQVIRDEIHIIDFHASSGADIAFYAGVITGKRYNYATHYLPHDARAKTLASGGKSVIEQLGNALGLANMAIVPELSVQDGIQASRMALPRCWFDRDKCNDGIEALKQYQREYDEDKKAFRERPRHDWTSHPADAFRMLAIAWQQEAKPSEQANPAIRGLSVGHNEVTLNELWQTVQKRSARI
jgi:phage terminase large subunit